MEANAAVRQNCINDPVTAKQEFATRGDIRIPEDVEFRVFGTTDDARHNLAVLVLPSANGGMSDEPANIMIGAWPLWGTRRQQIAALENELAFVREVQIAELENQLAVVREELAAKEASPAGPP
jgi:hypothetical protein